jgi:hypothetical protein
LAILELNIKLSQDFDQVIDGYTKLNDKTYVEITELIDSNSKKLAELDNKMSVEWTNTVKEFKENIISYKQSLSEKLDVLNEKSKNRTSKIKDICTNYFSSHEDTVTEIQTKVNQVTKAFDEWKMYVMNPQAFNEARVHSLDVK